MNRTSCATLLCALCGMLLVMSAAHGESPALRDEDVVRMYVAGTSVDRIVDTIRTSATDFDLSSEMMIELRLAGLPDEILDAMRRRQRELDAAIETAPAVSDSGEAPAPKLRIALEGRVRVDDHVDPQLAAELELGNDDDDRVFADVAVFVACVRPDHVPDQWRSKSPLGRDFIRAPRHRMLEFLGGAERRENKIAAGGTLSLDLPQAIVLALEPGTAHDLLVGVALQVGGRYYVAAADRADGVILKDADLELSARFRRAQRGVKVRVERPAEMPDEIEPADPDS